MDEFTRDSLLVKYARGTLSNLERRQLLDWIKENDENRNQLEDTLAIWRSTPVSLEEDAFETSHALEKLMHQLNQQEPEQKIESVRSKSNKTLMYRLSWVSGIAAAIILLFGSYAYVSELLSRQKHLPFTQKHTTEAEKKQYTLPDGTKVWLNAQTELSYPSTFSSHIREVKLSGEAFFEVVKDNQRPFVIHAGRTVTQVLGTSFNLKTLSNGEAVEISVVSGKVNFYLENRPAVKLALSPGMKGSVLPNADSVLFDTKIDHNVLAWQNDRLVFNDSTIEEIIGVMEKHFGVTILVTTPEILSCRFTSTFEDAKLTEVLDALAISLDLQYVHTAKQYSLRGKACK